MLYLVNCVRTTSRPCCSLCHVFKSRVLRNRSAVAGLSCALSPLRPLATIEDLSLEVGSPNIFEASVARSRPSCSSSVTSFAIRRRGRSCRHTTVVLSAVTSSMSASLASQSASSLICLRSLFPVSDWPTLIAAVRVSKSDLAWPFGGREGRVLVARACIQSWSLRKDCREEDWHARVLSARASDAHVHEL